MRWQVACALVAVEGCASSTTSTQPQPPTPDGIVAEERSGACLDEHEFAVLEHENAPEEGSSPGAAGVSRAERGRTMPGPPDVSLSLTSCENLGVSEEGHPFMDVRLRVDLVTPSFFAVGVSGGVPGGFSYSYRGRSEDEGVAIGATGGSVREVIDVAHGSRVELVFELALPQWLLEHGGEVEVSIPEWGRDARRRGTVVVAACRPIQ